jgi:hypothetical protein
VSPSSQQLECVTAIFPAWGVGGATVLSQHHPHEDRSIFDPTCSPLIASVGPGVDLPEIEEVLSGRIIKVFDHPGVCQFMRQDVGCL